VRQASGVTDLSSWSNRLFALYKKLLVLGVSGYFVYYLVKRGIPGIKIALGWITADSLVSRFDNFGGGTNWATEIGAAFALGGAAGLVASGTTSRSTSNTPKAHPLLPSCPMCQKPGG